MRAAARKSSAVAAAICVQARDFQSESEVVVAAAGRSRRRC